MTTAGTTRPVARRTGATAARNRSLRPDRATWPIWLLTVGMTPAFALGIHGVAWMLPALVFGVRIIASGCRFPRSSIPLALFVGWALLSISMLEPSNLPIFFYRWTLFAGCLTTFVWLTNVNEKILPTTRVVDWMAALWLFLIGAGYLGILLPHFMEPSPFVIALGPLGRIDFVTRISEWRLAETQGFLGFDLPRPAAPFGAANSWGSAVGILTPFFVRSWLVDVDARRRSRGILFLVLAILPILLSVNRGLWLGLGIALVYFAARKALRGRFGALAMLAVILGIVATLLVVTPAGDLVTDRIDQAEQSNDTRTNLYALAFEGARESPLVGHGVPIRIPDSHPDTPPVGTHGLLWYLMFIHGFVGLALFGSWLFTELFRSGRVHTPLGWYAHLSLVIATTAVAYYGLLPHVILIAIAAAIAHRESRTT